MQSFVIIKVIYKDKYLPSYLVDQVVNGGGLARVNVANDDNVDVCLLLSHLERFLDPVRLNASERMLTLTFKFLSDLRESCMDLVQLKQAKDQMT